MSGEPLVAAFSIVGAPSRLERASEAAAAADWRDATYAPAVLASYAPHAEPPQASAVAAFCAPHGLRLARAPAPPQFGCFVLTQGDGTRLYGHCLTVHAPLSPTTEVVLTAATDVAPSESAAPDGTATTTVGELLARDEEACFAPRCFCLLSLAHFPLAFKASLLALERMAQGAHDAPCACLLYTSPSPRDS